MPVINADLFNSQPLNVSLDCKRRIKDEGSNDIDTEFQGSVWCWSFFYFNQSKILNEPNEMSLFLLLRPSQISRRWLVIYCSPASCWAHTRTQILLLNLQRLVYSLYRMTLGWFFFSLYFEHRAFKKTSHVWRFFSLCAADKGCAAPPWHHLITGEDANELLLINVYVFFSYIGLLYALSNMLTEYACVRYISSRVVPTICTAYYLHKGNRMSINN